MAESAVEDLGLKKIIFMTGGMPPHKDSREIVDKRKRFKMVKLLVKGNRRFFASDYEIRSQERSYTSETLTHFKEKYPDSKIYFIVGVDSLYDIEKWHKPEIIFEKACIAVALRAGYDNELLNEKISYYQNKYNADIKKIFMPQIEISSSDIRNRVKEDKSIKYMTTKYVEKYIIDNGLYKSENYDI